MRSLLVVEVEVGAQMSARVFGCVVVLEINLLVFHRAPQPLDEDVVQSAASPVVADLHACETSKPVKCGLVNWLP